jgi:two-component system sensor histidine kinase/response regulator
MGGNIEVSSQVGEGSCFRFTLPLQVVNANGIVSTQPRRQAVALAPGEPEYRILVVDDKPESRRILRQLLEPVGFLVREAADGAEAIAVWEDWQPHLIWMDMRMPRTSGYEATREIRRREAERSASQPTKIVALTATVFDRQPAVVLEVGCDDFVSKPFQDNVIFEKMGEYLGVRYRYEDRKPSSSDRSVRGALSSQMFADLPQAWRVELHQAALSAREKQITRAIAQLPPEHRDLARGLTQLCDRFLFDRIVDLLEPYLSASEDR